MEIHPSTTECVWELTISCVLWKPPHLSGDTLQTGGSKFHLAWILAFVYLQSSCLLAALQRHFVSVMRGTLDRDGEGVLLKLQTQTGWVVAEATAVAERLWEAERQLHRFDAGFLLLAVLLQPQTSTAIDPLHAAGVKVDSHMLKPVLFLL